MPSAIKESNVDVLIIGAGPAGYMAANWFARMGVNARIIDKRSGKLFAGQADGLQSRTLEVFQSFGFGDRALKEANHMLEICFWDPSPDGGIRRSGRIPDTVIGISRFQQVVLHQGRIEAWMSDAMKKWSGGKMDVERNKQPVELTIDEDKVDDLDAYPVTLRIRHLNDDDATPNQFGSKIANGLFRQFGGEEDKVGAGEEEIVHAKYVLGCDGAHSWTRKELGVEMEGESTDFIWGVMDAVPITDFPDIRARCAIHSKDSGSIMIIPRENGLVRLYIQLKETPRDPATETGVDGKAPDVAAAAQKGRVDRSKITPEFIMQNAQKIFHPYKLEMIDVKWYTAYQIGQRVSPTFQKFNRVFIAGDACHTHSPKAGQGMNVSMMDTYNLAWKVGHVVKGLAKPEILATYEDERRQIARDLIDFDYKFSRLFSGKPASEDGTDGVSLKEFHRVFEKGNEFASGTIVDYEPSLIVKKPTAEIVTDKVKTAGGDKNLAFTFREEYFSPFATNVPVGRRLDSAQVVVQSDAKPIHLADRLLSDGRWRVLFFAGAIASNAERRAFTKEFGDYLDSPESFIKKYTPASARLGSVVDVVLVHASKRHEVEWNDFPPAFRHRDDAGRMDYWSILSDEPSYHKGWGKIYEKFGIDTEKGAIIVSRPDGHVSLVTSASSDGIKEVADFFGGVLVEQKKSWKSEGGYVRPKQVIEDIDTYGTNDIGFPILAV